ncbi:MAG: hypothetical protein J5850_01735, partial [Clostridia bacterium]|nr:hypothetical protein [Clostridia bacterium]
VEGKREGTWTWWREIPSQGEADVIIAGGHKTRPYRLTYFFQVFVRKNAGAAAENDFILP